MPTNVLFVAAEMAPLVKVGGLGDITGALPRMLRRIGLDVRVALPYYKAIDLPKRSVRRVAGLPDGAALWRADIDGVPVYLIEHAAFKRKEIYADDDGERFVAFCDAVLAAAPALGWQPDLLHLHDWHPGFLAARLAGGIEHPWAALPRVCTIHNLGFPGRFSAAFAKAHRIDRRVLKAPRGVRPRLPYSALAQSILHADLVSTVSPTYAREIVTPKLGGKLTPLLHRLGDRLSGILNGIDTESLDPATDPHLPASFDATHLDGRIENKRGLQRAFGLPVDDATPAVGMVTRLFWQKGADIAAKAVEQLLSKRDFQLIVLGQGDQTNERVMLDLAKRFPERVAVRIAFDAALGQLIYGGSDLFLMPSRYEPCGLGQMIAMRYGSVPVVRRTGGLADSVEAYDPAGRRGTGFAFDRPTASALRGCLSAAFDLYEDRRAWRALQRRAMARDSSWGRAAKQYRDLYRRAARVHKTAPVR
ncbi:MAG: glycogen synthase [Dehalococcoidia bacterium]